MAQGILAKQFGKKNNTPAPVAAAPKTAPKAPSKTIPAVDKLKAVEVWAATRVFGRKGEIRDMVLALIARQNVLFIGPPGTAKTMMVADVASAFCGPDDIFHTMLTKFSKPAEITGPVSLEALRQDEYKIDTRGYLPTAKVGILDEVFKGSSAILNTLLTLANERVFRNGHVWDPCPARMLVGMSNEFPEDPATLAAFFDRFPVKRLVGYLTDKDFETMIGATSIASTQSTVPATLDDKDFKAIDDAVAACVLTQDMIRVIGELRALLKAKGVKISDRRWVQAVRLLKASAVYDGRTEVQRRDLLAIEGVLWDNEQQINTIKAELPNFVNPHERTLRQSAEECYSYRAKIIEAAKRGRGPNDPLNTTEAASEAARALSQVNNIKIALEKIKSSIDDDASRELYAMTVVSVDKVHEAIQAVALGKGDLAVLVNTSEQDIGKDVLIGK